jgi:hypothetical protein
MKNSICAILAVLGLVAMCGPAMAHPPNGRGATVPSSDLPPIIPEGYLSPADVHAMYSGPALEVVLSMLQHQPFAGMSIPDPAGERHHFESNAQGQISVNGSPNMPFTAGGPVDTVAYGRPPGGLGTFDTEMLQMTLSGNSPLGPFMIRESPTRASTGKTSIADIGGGMYHIDSFFDVFTDLSIDGGNTWIPSSDSVRVYLGGIPEPASVLLVLLGLVGAAGLIGRRR